MTITSLLLTVLLCPILISVFCVADPIHLPISRRSTHLWTPADHFAAAERARARYGFASGTNKTLGRRATTVNLEIGNQHADAGYFAAIQIGTPGQSFNVILDTGSSDLFVLDSSCNACDPSTSFDPSKSSSFTQTSRQPTTISYGSGDVAGFVATDTVSLGGFTLSSQPFLLVEEFTDGLISGSISGLIGLAFPALAETNQAPFWQALIEANQLSAPEMAFQLTRSQSISDQPGGVFTLGGTNSSLFTGDIEFLDLTGSSTPTFWTLSVSAVTVQGNAVNVATGSSALAAIDTGTTLVGGPTDDVKAIWAAVPGSSAVPDGSGFFQFPCTTSVSITMSFGGKAWPISTEDMNLGPVQRGSSMCIGGIFDLTQGIATGPGNPNWVVGDVFLKNVYSVFRQEPLSVGFAQLAGEPGSTSPPQPPPQSASLPPTPALPTSRRSTALGPTGTGPNTSPPGSDGSPTDDSNAAYPKKAPMALLFSLVLTALAAFI
ncbi:aspartic peptidase domain-containing protein [Mycena rebaudengoi]|nr:aspartic peptidase domain-containing protein [Mycena rebaudengoi]